MVFIGIHEGRIAVLKRDKGKIDIVELSSDVKLLDKFKKCVTATGLETTDIARREVVVKLQKEKEILAVLPFQLEPLLPFSMNEAVVVPLLYPREDGLTDVVVFATTERLLAAHLEKAGDSDVVSTVATALARFGAFENPSLPQFYILHEGTAIAVSHGKIVFAQSYTSGEEARIEPFLQSKWSGIPKIEIASEYAVAIGLALDNLQFRHEPSAKNEKKKKRYIQTYLAAIAILTGVVWSCLPREESLPQKIAEWEESLEKTPSSLHVPAIPVSSLLAWLSSRDESIEVVRLHYSLAEFPKLDVVKVDLEFTSPSPGIARAFHEALLQGEGSVDPRREISWSLSGDRYHTSFFLRRLL